MSEPRELRVVTVGHRSKTVLLMVLNDKPFPERYIPTVFENYTLEVNVNNAPWKFHMWDTADQDEYARLRPLSYSGTNVVLLVFDLSSKASFKKLDEYWIDEVKFYCRDAKILLIGTKLDLRETGNPNHVTDQEAEQFVKEHECAAYIPCSPKTGEGIDKIYPAAVQAFETEKEAFH